MPEPDHTSADDEGSEARDDAPSDEIFLEGGKARQEGGKTAGLETTAGLVKRTRETLAREAEVERETQKAISGKTSAGLAKRGSAHAEGWLTRAVSKLRAALSPAAIGESAQASILFWHWLLFDRDFDKLLFRNTAKPAKIKTLTVHGDRAEGRDYRPTPTLVFEWVMSAIRDDLSHYRLVDYGAGRGRVLMMAAQYPFKSIDGAEFAEELFEDARLNIAQFPRPRMRCREVACELLDARRIATPEGTVVHYFFAPFSRKAFAEILNRIATSIRESPRPAYIVLVDSRDGDLVRQTGLFTAAKMKLGARLESFFFSPYRIEVYRAKDG